MLHLEGSILLLSTSWLALAGTSGIVAWGVLVTGRGILLSGSVGLTTFQKGNSLECLLLIGLQVKHFTVCNHSFFWLVALLVQDAQIEPDLVELRLESCRFDDVLKWLSVLVTLIKKNGEGSPENSIGWWLESRLLQTFVGFIKLFEEQVATATNVERVDAVAIAPFCFANKGESFVDVACLEFAPSQMLVDLVVFVVVR